MYGIAVHAFGDRGRGRKTGVFIAFIEFIRIYPSAGMGRTSYEQSESAE